MNRVNSGPNTFKQKGRSIYFWTETVESLCSSITVPPPLVGEDIKLLGFVSSFLRETKSRLDPFFSACVPFSWLSGSCHMKTMAGTRWKTHKPTYANPPLSPRLQALSCTLSRLWYITFKTPILTHIPFNVCSLLFCVESAAITVNPVLVARCLNFKVDVIYYWIPHNYHYSQ